MTTIDTIKNRLVAICPLIALPGFSAGTASTKDPEEVLLDEALPFYLIRDGRGIEYRKLEQGAYLAIREMTIAVHLIRMGDESYTQDADAQAAAEACIQPLGRAFLGNPTLRLHDNGIVRECRTAADTGVRTLILRNPGNTDYTKYRGVVLKLRVTFIDMFNEEGQPWD